MAEAYEVLIPLLNPNEPELQITAIMVENGQRVDAGEVLCVVETTKSSSEISAERSGYVISMEAAVGDKLRAGDRLCWLASKASWKAPTSPDPELAVDSLAGMRITKPARDLVEQRGLSVELLPSGVLITEAVVQQILSEQRTISDDPGSPTDPTALLIYGGGGHSKALIDLVRAVGSWQIIAIIDDGMRSGTEVMGVPVRGGAEQLRALAQSGVRLAANAVGGIGDINSRIRVFERLHKLDFGFPTLIHPSAWVEPGARLEAGVQVFPHAYIGSDAAVGVGVIVNTGAVVSHDCQLEDYVNVAPGALLAGNVTLGKGVLVGMGVTVNLNVKVGAGARIGNSAVVKSDVPAGQVVRAGTVWPVD